MRILGSKFYWVCSIMGVIMLAVLANLLLGHEKANPITIQNGKIRAVSAMDRSQSLLPTQRLRFIANHGQAGADVLYHVQGAGHTVLFYQDRIVLRRTETEIRGHEVVLKFEGANRAPEIEGANRLTGVAHFYKGSDPGEWQTNVPTYGRVVYRNLYPGIDMAYTGDDGTLKSEFYLAPGADHRRIRLNYENVVSRKIGKDGALVLDTHLGELVEKAPIAYQEIDGVRSPIEVRYLLLADETVGFELGDYSRDVPVVIDPELVFLVSYGAALAITSATGVAIDGDGNVVLAGRSNLTFPATDAIPGSNDASLSGLLMKLDGTTGEILFSALFGGSGIDAFSSLALDINGNMYLTGSTESDDFPVMNAAQGIRAGGSDAFLAILTSDAVLTYSTYLGGSDFDEGRDVSLDGAGNVFVGGNTASANFPTTAGAFQQLFKGGTNPFSGDFFVAKYNASGGVDFATYLGGQVDDRVCNIVANASGQVTITGVTNSVDFPVTNAFQSLFGGGGFFGGDITVSRLNSAGDGLIYSTYFGGAGSDNCSGIALGPNDDIFVSGSTWSDDFPVIGGTSNPETGVSDGILLMIDNTGQPVYSIRSNITGEDGFGALSIDESGTAIPVSQQGAFIRIYEKTLTDPLEETFSFDAPVQHRVNVAYLTGDQMVLAGDFLPAAGKGASLGASVTEAWAAKFNRGELPEVIDRTTTISTATSDEPVNLFTGHLFSLEEPDLETGGPLPLFFQRFYSSVLIQDGNLKSSLGSNWTHNFDSILKRFGEKVVQVITSRGRVIMFEKVENDWKLLVPETTPFQLIADGQDFVFGDPQTGLLSTYDDSGRMTKIEDQNGNTHTLSYNGDLISQVSDGLGRTLSFSYDGNSQLIGVSDGSRAISFSYAGNLLSTYSNAENGLTAFTYDTGHTIDGLLLAKTLPEGNTLFLQEYDDQGRVVRQTDALGNVTTYTYSPIGGKSGNSGLNDHGPIETIMTDPDGNSMTFIHDESGANISFQDEMGFVITKSYDDLGRLSSLVDRRGSTLVFEYHEESGKLASRTDANGNKTFYSHTERILPNGLRFYDQTATMYANGTSDHRIFDSAGNVISETDQAGNVWNYTHNDKGQPLTARNPEGGTTVFNYSGDGTLSSETDNAGNTTTYQYDGLRRLRQITHPDGTSRSSTRDALSRVTSTANELGYTTTYAHDQDGNLISVTDPLGNEVSYAYDQMGRVTSVIDAAGYVSLATYDRIGRLDGMTNEEGNFTRINSDARGDVVQVIDPASGTRTSTYSANRRLTNVTNHGSATSTMTYDRVGNLTSVTGPLGDSYRFAYNNVGLLSSLQDPLTNETALVYDPNGYISGISMAGGLKNASYDRNGLDQIIRVVDPMGNTMENDYDQQGRLVRRTDPLGKNTSVQYDQRSRPSTVVFPDGMGALNIAYDNYGNIKERSFSDGTLYRYDYDANNFRTSATDVAFTYDERASIINTNGIDVERDRARRIAALTLAPDKKISYVYDSRGLVTRMTDWIGESMTFTYDDAGNLQTIMRSNGVVTTYSYDDHNRLTAIVESGKSSISLNRDANGQIVAAERNVPLKVVPGPSSTSFSFDAASQITGFDYDSMGRLTNDGQRSYTWNLDSRLISYTEAGSTVDFTRDAFGSLLTRGTQTYIWNYAFELPVISKVAEDGGSDTRYYVHSADGRLLYSIEAADSTRHFFHFDEMGSTLFLTDDEGSIEARYAYSPFGSLIGLEGAVENPFTYLGRFGVMQEGASGLFHMRQRIYDSTNRRFLSREPIADQVHPQKINPYQYALSNPLLYMDPTGEDPEANTGAEASQSESFVADVLGFFGTLTGVFLETVEQMVKETGNLSEGLSKNSKVTKVLGAGAKAAGGIAAGLKTSESMDQSADRRKAERDRALATYFENSDRWMKLAKSGTPTEEVLKQLARLKKDLDEELESIGYHGLVDAAEIFTAGVLNVITGLIPGAGLVIDWSSIIGGN